MEFYDASAAGQADAASDPLLRLQARDSEQRMLALLGEIDEFVAESRARDLDAGLDPGIATLLDAITGADDAPLEFRSLHRRVHDGTLSWEQFWSAPEQEAGGAQLVNVAMKAAGAELTASLRDLEEQEHEQRQDEPKSR